MCHSVPTENFISFPFMLIAKKRQTRDIIHNVSPGHTAMKSKMTAIKPGWCCNSPPAHCTDSQPAESFLDSRCSRGWMWGRTSTPETSGLRKWNKMNKQTNKMKPSQNRKAKLLLKSPSTTLERTRRKVKSSADLVWSAVIYLDIYTLALIWEQDLSWPAAFLSSSLRTSCSFYCSQRNRKSWWQPLPIHRK